jgi:N-acetylneuraminate synthase
MAFQLIEVAAHAGADAVKFQTFSAERLATLGAPKAGYQETSASEHQSQLAMLKELELPAAWHGELQQYARELGIVFISTAFDVKSLAFLETLDLPYYKIPSGEISNGPLLLAFAQTGKKLVLSTGMATLSEVEQALAVIAYGLWHRAEPENMERVWRFWSAPEAKALLEGKLTLLHCTSQYPTPMEEVNLRAMKSMADAFSLPVGYSDHTQGFVVATAAVALGATIIEKHFTLDRDLPGPDHAASVEPNELKELVSSIRKLEVALGDGVKRPQSSEWDTRKAARQQVIFTEPVTEGETITREMLDTARCGDGVSPVKLWELVGQKATRSFKPGDRFE